MPISTPPPPAGGLALVSQAVENFEPRPHLGELLKARPAPQYRENALPIFALNLADLGGPQPLASARQVGWRYLVQRGETLAMVDLGGVDPSELRIHALRRGARAARVNTACEVAGTIALAGAAVTARILSIPQLHLEALWLHGSDADLFVRTKAPQNRAVEPFDMIAEARRLADRRNRPADLNSREDRGG